MTYKYSLILFYAIIFLSCSHLNHTDIATVSGKFSDSVPAEQGNKPVNIILTVRDAILGENIEYETRLREDGTFSFSVPIVCESFGRINSEFYKCVINLAPDKESKFEVAFDEKSGKKVSFIKGFGFTENELDYIYKISMQVYEAYNADDTQFPSPETKQEPIETFRLLITLLHGKIQTQL